MKVYSFLPREEYFAIADKAKKQGIPFAGHVRAQLFVKPSFYHIFGEAIWMEYEFRTNFGEKTAVSRGSALWSNADSEWRVAHLNRRTRPGDPVAVSNH